ncbi:MAG: hypothetical protein WDM79_05645 [Terricaulis sp.]
MSKTLTMSLAVLAAMAFAAPAMAQDDTTISDVIIVGAILDTDAAPAVDDADSKAPPAPVVAEDESAED